MKTMIFHLLMLIGGFLFAQMGAYQPVHVKYSSQTTYHVLDSFIFYHYFNTLSSYIPLSKHVVIERTPGAAFLPFRYIYYTYDTITSSWITKNLKEQTYQQHVPGAQVKTILWRPWNSSTGQWNDTSFYIHLTGYVNQALNMVLYTYMLDKFYDFTNNQFIDGNKYINTIANDTLITQSEHFLLNTSTMTYEPNAKTTYSYNSSHLPAEIIRYNYSTALQSYEPMNKELRYYDANKHLIEHVWSDWIMGSWQYFYRHLSSYNSSGLLSEEITQFWDNFTLNWNNSSRITYSYTPTNKLDVKTMYNWDQATSSWIESIIYQCTYNSLDQLETSITYFFDGLTIEPLFKDEYTYDSQGNVITKTTYNWVSGIWKNYLKQIFTYNAQNKIENISLYLWDGSSWYLYEREFWQYDLEQELVLYEYWGTLGSGIQPYYKELYWYSDIDATAIHTYEQTHYRIFPNPASHTIHLSLPYFSGSAHVNITDSKGSLLMSFEVHKTDPVIDISQLKAGKYLMTVSLPYQKTHTFQFMKIDY